MMRACTAAMAAAVVAAIAFSGCAGSGERNCAANGQPSIGTATMQDDGTIVMQMRAGHGPGEARGDARITYPPGHPQYREIIEHVGGLRPGETKNVPPWTDE